MKYIFLKAINKNFDYKDLNSYSVVFPLNISNKLDDYDTI